MGFNPLRGVTWRGQFGSRLADKSILRFFEKNRVDARVRNKPRQCHLVFQGGSFAWHVLCVPPSCYFFSCCLAKVPLVLPRVTLTFVTLRGCTLGWFCKSSEYSMESCDFTVAQEAPKKLAIRGWVRFNFLWFVLRFFCVLGIPSCSFALGPFRWPAKSDLPSTIHLQKCSAILLIGSVRFSRFFRFFKTDPASAYSIKKHVFFTSPFFWVFLGYHPLFAHSDPSKSILNRTWKSIIFFWKKWRFWL